MNPISGINPMFSTADPAAMQRAMTAGGKTAGEGAAQQFEAVLLRQILSEAIPSMTGIPGSTPAPGADIYKYMLTDLIAQQMTQGGGLGFAKAIAPKLEPQATKETGS